MKYNPEQSIKENAVANGLSEASIRRYIKINNIDRRYEAGVKLYLAVKRLQRLHPDWSARAIARELKISQTTVSRYQKMDTIGISEGKKSVIIPHFDSNTPIDFTKIEEYNTDLVKVVPFSRSGLIYYGWDISFGNMNPKYPLDVFGHHFTCPEIPYIACFYGEKNTDCIRIQKEIITFAEGAKRCKQIYRRNEINTKFGRADFHESTWHFQLMLYLVWCKCLQNPEFAQMLLAIPDDWVIIENQNGFNSIGTVGDWGCVNVIAEKERRQINKAIKQSQERNMVKRKDSAKLETGQHGIWIGMNHQGKILMACRAALRTNSIPYIDFNSLNMAHIYFLGNLLRFPE